MARSISRSDETSPGAVAKQVEVQIGPNGKDAGKWSLKKERYEWDRIRGRSKDTGNDPHELKKSHKQDREKGTGSDIPVIGGCLPGMG